MTDVLFHRVPAFHVLRRGHPARAKGYKYQLLEPLVVTVNVRCPHERVSLEPWLSLAWIPPATSELRIGGDYCWDGASGPALDTISFVVPSVVHDALYQLMREGLLPRSARAEVDAALRDLSEWYGMRFWRRWWVWAAVRLGGWAAARPVARPGGPA